MRLFLKTLLLACTVTLVACAGPKVDDYANEKPELRLQDYFNGDLEAWGMFQKRNGEVARRFHVKMTGTWDGDTGVLDEHFTYSDGTLERRVWTLSSSPTAAGGVPPMTSKAKRSASWLATPSTGNTPCD